MEDKKFVRPQKPSRLKPPQIRTIKHLPLSEDISNKPSVIDATTSRNLMRRSKSFSNLHLTVNRHKNTEGAVTVSKLSKLSSLRPLQNITENVKEVSPTKTVPASNMLSRRSKSTVDLRLIGDKSKVISKTNQRIRPATVVNKVTQKRKAETLSDEVKPKVVKQVKIPDWDYKGRYNQLREKHITLNEENKKHKEKAERLSTIEEKYDTLKDKYDVLESKYTTLKHTSSNALTEIDNLNREVSELKETNIKLSKKCEDYVKLSDEYHKLIEEHKTLNTNYLNLEINHTQVKQEYEDLLKIHNTLKTDFDKKLTENEELHLNLTLANKTIIKQNEENNTLKRDLNNSEILRRKLHNLIQDLKGNIRVFCRVRPIIKSEEELPQCLINFIDEKTIEVRKSRESVSAISGKVTDLKAEFSVDKIFEPRSTQYEVFEEVAQLVQSALDGYDVCVFAYGQTGSGKTYTMQGEEISEKKGMIPRTIDLIFETIANLRISGWSYEVSASFLEIYNENVRDLLNPNPTQNLDIRYNEGKGITVPNLLIQKLNSAEELKNLMALAQRNRAVAATNFNEHSSRSHAITKIYLEGVNNEMNLSYVGSVNLVDLAGSESAKTSSNERLIETKNINKSLSALESVMLALYNKEKHIPYRNSKLTFLLQSCLGGSSKTLMVVNIAPLEECYTESIYSLRFAAKVKEVKMSAKRNKTYCLPAITKM